jgi:hypothetical protein
VPFTPAPTFFCSKFSGRVPSHSQEISFLAQSRLPSPLRARFMKSGGKSLHWNASSADSNGVRVLLGLIS